MEDVWRLGVAGAFLAEDFLGAAVFGAVFLAEGFFAPPFFAAAAGFVVDFADDFLAEAGFFFSAMVQISPKNKRAIRNENNKKHILFYHTPQGGGRGADEGRGRKPCAWEEKNKGRENTRPVEGPLGSLSRLSKLVTERLLVTS
ncbi:MAG: hypothetical protein OEV94_11195 [Deltaproteobacteria bacterium]|nr:hypothetical protein [Deltaproteobacteria bacterium]